MSAVGPKRKPTSFYGKSVIASLQPFAWAVCGCKLILPLFPRRGRVVKVIHEHPTANIVMLIVQTKTQALAVANGQFNDLE